MVDDDVVLGGGRFDVSRCSGDTGDSSGSDGEPHGSCLMGFFESGFVIKVFL
jgi:hypothetical protein